MIGFVKEYEAQSAKFDPGHRHKLSRDASHRKALLSNLACSLIEHGKIKTTLGKAKALRARGGKIVVVDREVAFVGGINLMDDRYDLNHGWTDEPRLDFAVRVTGPVTGPIHQATIAAWSRAHLGRAFKEEALAIVRGAEPLARVSTTVEARVGGKSGAVQKAATRGRPSGSRRGRGALRSSRCRRWR